MVQSPARPGWPQTLNLLIPFGWAFRLGLIQVLGSFSWAGSQEVPPLLCVTKLVPSNAE